MTANPLLALLLTGVLGAVATQAAAKELTQYPVPPVDAARLKTRTACSCLFVQNLSPAQCLAGKDEIYQYLFVPRQQIPGTDQQRFDVSITSWGAVLQLLDGGKPLAQSYFVNDGGGCFTSEPGRKLGIAMTDPPAELADQPAPLPRAAMSTDVDKRAVSEALDSGFSADGPLRGFTRAVVIVHGGKIVEERYAPMFGPQNRYYLGSVSKVFNNLLAGLLVRDGKLRVDEPVALPAWSAADDPRRAITFDQMLHMTSGLAWEEEFFRPGAPGYNVFLAGPESLDVARYVSSFSLEAKPGTHYEYSTGASMLLGQVLQRRIVDTGQADTAQADRARTLRFLARELLQPIGAVGVVAEFDEAQTLLTGESIYARPEDMARIGLLLQQKGRWQTKQLLPKDWIEYSTARTATQSPDDPYGAHLALDYVVPGCFGHTGVGGNKLIVCPERELVIAWLSSDFDLLGFGEYARLRAAYDGLEKIQQQLIRAFPATAAHSKR